jgi:hypothetical protein
MITDQPTRPPEAPLRRAAQTQPADPIGLLIRIYRQAGLPLEEARRSAQADFQCSFPEVLTAGL